MEIGASGGRVDVINKLRIYADIRLDGRIGADLGAARVRRSASDGGAAGKSRSTSPDCYLQSERASAGGAAETGEPERLRFVEYPTAYSAAGSGTGASLTRAAQPARL